MSTTIEREQSPRRRPRRGMWAVVLAAVAVVAAIVAVAVVTLSGNDQTGPSTPSSAATAAPSQPTAATSSAGPTASVAPSSEQPPPGLFGYQPLWPFSTTAEAEAWQRDYRSGGHSPWHLDADATALAFTTGYLGFTGVNVVVSHSIDGNEALVTVGYPIEGRAPATAAVLHLAKYGSGADAPWEVVGSKDTALTLTQPAYGAKASSPITVGGRITGVDENIRVQVRQPQSPSPIGDAPGVPAGGENTPWSTTVSYQGATAPALTLVAWTGGHYTDVERFAITGVHP